MSDGELLNGFDKLFMGSWQRTQRKARLGRRINGVTTVANPARSDRLYISLGDNGDEGPTEAEDACGVDTSVAWQRIRVRFEQNRWVIYSADHYAGGGGGPSGSTTLDGLTDVSVAGATGGQLLSYNAATGQWIPFTPTGTTGGAPSPHPLDSTHHTPGSTLSNAQGPQFLLKDGSRPLENDMLVVSGKKIDGVDISAHDGDHNIHHDKATAGAGIEIAPGTQVIAVDLDSTNSGLEFSTATPGDLRVKNFNGIKRDDNGISILLKPGMTALKVDPSGLYLDDVIAGQSLGIDPTTKILSVRVGDGLQNDVPNDQVKVDKGHNFIWTGTHQFNQLTTFNNNIHFMSAARSVTSDSALNLTPSGDLYLAPIANTPLTRQIRVRNTIPINSDNFQDLPTNIDGLHFWQPTDGVNQWQLNINAIKADQLFVRVFTVDETRLARGQEYWSKSFGIVETSFNLPADEATVDVWFEDVPDLPINAPLFDAGDWLQIRTIDIAAGYPAITVWFTVVDADATGTNDWILREDAVAPTATSNGHGPRQKWRLKRENGGATGLLIRKGVVVLDAGTPGTAWIHLNALTGNLGSSGPYIQMGIMDSIQSSDVPLHKNRIRIGNLKDAAGFASTVYGMAAGNDLSLDPDDGLYSGFTLEDVGGLRLYNTDFQLYEGGIKVLTLDNEGGMSLVQDTAPNDDTQSAITWWDSVHAPLAVKAHITSWRDINTDAGLHIEAQTLVAGRRSVLFLQASSQGGFADISLVSPASGGTSVQVNADFVTLVDKVFVGTGGAIPGVTPPTSTLHVWDNSSAIDQTIGLLIQNSSTGDATARFYVSAAPSQYYTMGIDNSDGNKFKISIGPKLGDSSGAVDFFVYDPATNLVTLSGLTGGGGGGGTPTVQSGDGIAVSGGGPYIVAVNGSVARDTWRVNAGAGLQGGGYLSSAHIELEVSPGPGIGFLGDTLIVALATNPGLNTAAGLQLDATVAGDGLEWTTVTSRVMQASLGNGLVFTGTTPARDITIKLRSSGTTSSGLIVDTDGLYIRRRGDSGNESGLSMNTAEGLYIADNVAGAGLEWVDDVNRYMRVAVGGGLEYNDLVGGTGSLVRVMLPANSGILRDATGIYLDPALAGNGLLMTAGEIDIVPSATGGLVVTANDISIKRRTVGAGSGLNTSTDGLHIQRRNSSGNDSGITMTIADGIYLADNVANQGLEWTGTPERFLRLKLAGGLEFSSTAATASVRVDLGFNYAWTANHTFGTAGLFRVDSIAQFNNNINFMGARTILSTGNLTVDTTGNLNLTPSGTLTLDPGGLISLPNAQELRTVTYNDNVAGIAGLRHWDTGGNIRMLTIGKLKADELHVRVFSADEQRVSRGAEFWSRSFGIVQETFDVPADEATVDVWFEEAPDLGTFALFIPNNWVQFRTIDQDTGLVTQSIWFQVVDGDASGTNNYVARENEVVGSATVESVVSRQQWRLRRKSGGITGMTVRKGNVAVEFGLPADAATALYTGQFKGQGVVHLSALHEDGGPFIQIQTFETVTAAPNQTPVFKNRVRMGNLTGITDITGVFWGFAAGNDLSLTPDGGYSGFTVGKGIGSPGTDYDGMRLFNTDINMYNSGSHELLIPSSGGIRILQGGSNYNDRNAIAWFEDVSDTNSRVANLSSFTLSTGEHVFQLQNYFTDVGETASINITNTGISGLVYVQLSSEPSVAYMEIGAPDYVRFETPKVFVGNYTGDSTLHVFENTTAVGITAGLTIHQWGTGDAVLQWLLKSGPSDTQRYVMGIDNSDGDKLKIVYSVDLASNPILIYDPATDGVGIGRTPGAGIKLHVNGSTMTPTIQGTTASNGDITIEGTSSATKTTSYVLLQPTGGWVGVGTTTPLTLFSISADGASAGISAASYGTTFAAQLILYSANGTEAVPLPTVSSDLLGQIVFQGWDTARSTGASIRATASANWGTAADDTDNPTNLSFWTTPDGFSVQEERFTILSNGNIGIEQPAPAFKLDVTGTLNATGAVTFGSSLAIAGALSGVTNLAIAGTLTGVTNLAIAGTLTGVTNLTMSGALTGATALTAATITANTTFIGNTFAARTAAGLSINDSSGNLAIFVESGGFVGINSADPLNRFEVVETTLNAGVANFVINANDGVTIRGMTFRNSDQTAGSVHGLRFDFTTDTGAITRGGALAFGKEGLFTSSVGSRDAYMALMVSVDGALEEHIRLTSAGSVGIGTPTPQFRETLSRFTVSGSDSVAHQISVENEGTGQVGIVLRRIGGTAARWYPYIPAGSTNLVFYHATQGNVMTLSGTTGEVTLAANLQVNSVSINTSLTAGAISGNTLMSPDLFGSNSANGDLLIEGTSHATKTSSYVLLQPTSGYVGVGTTVPGAWMDVAGDGATTPGVRISQYGVAAPHFVGRRSVGGKTSPSAVNNLHVLMHLAGYGYTSGGWAANPNAEIKFVATETYLGTSYGGAEMQFWVHPNGTGSPVGQAMTIYNDRGVSLHNIFDRATTPTNRPRPLIIDSNGYLTGDNIYSYALSTVSHRPLSVNSDGMIGFGDIYGVSTATGQSPSTYRPVIVDSNGRFTAENIYRHTVGGNYRPVYVSEFGMVGGLLPPSARRFKEQIEDVGADVAERFLAGLRPVTFVYKADENRKVQIGLIAEEVEEAGGKDYVIYDEEGQAEGIAYDRLIVPTIIMIMQLKRQIEILQAEVQVLKGS